MLSLRNVVISRGGRPVIRGASARAAGGEIVALLGPNGAGKTTLLHFIAGVLKSDSGDLYYGGRKVDPSCHDWRLRLAYVLDDGGIIPLLTVEEQLFLHCALIGVDRGQAAERTRRVIDLLDLNRYRGYRADELSSGLRKRLGIALGIIRTAEVFLFDEPFSALDAQSIAILGRILATLGDRGRIVILASHSLQFLEELCSRVWTLTEGTVADHPGRPEVSGLLTHPSRSTSPGGLEIDMPWIR